MSYWVYFCILNSVSLCLYLRKVLWITMSNKIFILPSQWKSSLNTLFSGPRKNVKLEAIWNLQEIVCQFYWRQNVHNNKRSRQDCMFSSDVRKLTVFIISCFQSLQLLLIKRPQLRHISRVICFMCTSFHF